MAPPLLVLGVWAVFTVEEAGETVVIRGSLGASVVKVGENVELGVSENVELSMDVELGADVNEGSRDGFIGLEISSSK